MEKIILPIKENDKKLLIREADKLRLALASYCRLILINNLNKKSSSPAEIGLSAGEVLANLQDNEQT